MRWDDDLVVWCATNLDFAIPSRLDREPNSEAAHLNLRFSIPRRRSFMRCTQADSHHIAARLFRACGRQGIGDSRTDDRGLFQRSLHPEQRVLTVPFRWLVLRP